MRAVKGNLGHSPKKYRENWKGLARRSQYDYPTLHDQRAESRSIVGCAQNHLTKQLTMHAYTLS